MKALAFEREVLVNEKERRAALSTAWQPVTRVLGA